MTGVDIKVNQLQQAPQIEQPVQQHETDGTFKFTLVSRIEEQDLQNALSFWMMVIPAVILLFACVYGITVNLHFPVLDWENEVSVVKQSASAVLGGMGGAVLAILGGAGACLVPEGYSGGYRAVLCVLLLGITCLMYRKNNRIDLREL